MKKQGKKPSDKEILKSVGKTEEQLKTEILTTLNASDEEFEKISKKNRKMINKISQRMKPSHQLYSESQKNKR